MAWCCAVAVLWSATTGIGGGRGSGVEIPFLSIELEIRSQRRRVQVSPGDLLVDGLLTTTGPLLVAALLFDVDLRVPLALGMAALHFWVFPRARRQVYGACRTLEDLKVGMGALNRLEAWLIGGALLWLLSLCASSESSAAPSASVVLATRPRTLPEWRLTSSLRDGVVEHHRVRTAHTQTHWVIEILQPMTIAIPREDPDYADILMVTLYQARDERGRSFLDQATIGELFRLSRQMTNARIALYRRRERIEDVLAREWRKHALTPEVVEAIHEMLLEDPFLAVSEIRKRLLEAGLVPRRGDISLSPIKTAVRALDFLQARQRLREMLKQGTVVPNYEKLCEILLQEMAEMAEAAGRELGQHILAVDRLVDRKEAPPPRAPPCPDRDPPATLDEWLEPTKGEDSNLASGHRMSFLMYFAFGASYREIASYLGVRASTVYRRFQSLRRRLPRLQNLLGAIRYSGIVAVDEKYILAPKPFREGKMARWVYLFVAIDPRTYDLLHAQVYPARTTECAKAFLLGLKARGVLTPKVLVTDLWKPYENAIREVFPRATHHQCVFHAEQAVSDLMRDKLGADFRTLPSAQALRQAIVHLFRAGSRRTLIRRYRKLLRQEDSLTAQYPELGAVFDSLTRHFPKLANAYSDRRLAIPRTNNAVELVIRTFTRRYKTMAGFERIETAQAYVELWSWYYRFRPFSPDANPRIRNRSPLQLAGYDIDAASGFDLARPPPRPQAHS